VYVCVYVRVCVCAREKGGGIERTLGREKEKDTESVCVCVCHGEVADTWSICCDPVRDDGVYLRESMCVWCLCGERKRMCVCVRVKDRERERERVCVCVCHDGAVDT